MNALLFTWKKCQAFEGKIRTVLGQGNKKMTASSLVSAGTIKDFSWDWTYSLLFSPGLDYPFLFLSVAGSGPRREEPALNMSYLALASYSPWARKQHDLNGLRMPPHTWEHVPMVFQAHREKHQLGRPFCPVGARFYFSNILIYFSNRKIVTLKYKWIYTK